MALSLIRNYLGTFRTTPGHSSICLGISRHRRSTRKSSRNHRQRSSRSRSCRRSGRCRATHCASGVKRVLVTSSPALNPCSCTTPIISRTGCGPIDLFGMDVCFICTANRHGSTDNLGQATTSTPPSFPKVPDPIRSRSYPIACNRLQIRFSKDLERLLELSGLTGKHMFLIVEQAKTLSI